MDKSDTNIEEAHTCSNVSIGPLHITFCNQINFRPQPERQSFIYIYWSDIYTFFRLQKNKAKAWNSNRTLQLANPNVNRQNLSNTNIIIPKFEQNTYFSFIMSSLFFRRKKTERVKLPDMNKHEWIAITQLRSNRGLPYFRVLLCETIKSF